MHISQVKSKFNYFGNIDKLPFILNRIKNMNNKTKTIMISENNMILEIIFKYNEKDESLKDNHIDFIIEELKKINLQGNVSLRKTYGNIYIF